MTKILLVRHGHVEGIEPPRFRGRQDVPLSDRGLAQARAAAACIVSRWAPTVIYMSPLQRCVQTAREIAQRSGITAEPLADLMDLDYGAWQWQTYREVAAHSPQLFALWQAAPHLVRFPRGESLQDLLARAANAVRTVTARHLDQTVVMVSHDSTNRALLLHMLEQPLSAYWRLAQDPCGLSEIDVAGNSVTVRRINETGHL